MTIQIWEGEGMNTNEWEALFLKVDKNEDLIVPIRSYTCRVFQHNMVSALKEAVNTMIDNVEPPESAWMRIVRLESLDFRRMKS